VPLLALTLAIGSFGLPHWYFLSVERRPTFFERETTLWLTDLLLVLSSSMLAAFSTDRSRNLIAYMMAGVAIGVFGYVLLTTDLVPAALSGDARYRLAGLAVISSLLLTLPAIVLGIWLGRRLRPLAAPLNRDDTILT
jgi:hypothetical protein